MPLLHFTPEDFLRGTLVKPNWYPVEISRIGEAHKAKSSSNLVCDVYYKIIDGEFKGVEKKKTMSLKPDALGFWIPIMEAVEGKKIEPQTVDLDTDKLVGKQIKIEITQEIYEGNMVNQITNYAALEKSTNAPW